MEARSFRAAPAVAGRVARPLEMAGPRSKLPHAAGLLEPPTLSLSQPQLNQALGFSSTPDLPVELRQLPQAEQLLQQLDSKAEEISHQPRRRQSAAKREGAPTGNRTRKQRQPASSKRKGKAAAASMTAAGTAAAQVLPVSAPEEATAAAGPKPHVEQDAQSPPAPTRSKHRSSKKKAGLPSKDADILRWYSEAVRSAEHAHKSSPGKHTAAMFGHALREPVQEWLDARLEYVGFESRPFPQLLPLDLLLELGVNGEEASSVCTSHVFAHWAKSSSSLPVLASQWHDVDSWDLDNPGLLLHESHAAHERQGTAEEHAQAMIELYGELCRDIAGLPVVVGRRPASGTLSGAAASYTVEAMVGAGRALQVAQSHHLADNYSRALGASYSTSAEQQEWGGEFMSQMGSGLRASLLGGVTLAHGDDAGLALPPTLAPVQVVITPVLTRSCNRQGLADEAERVRAALAAAGVRVAVDNRRLKPAVRFRASEQLGAPLRIEIGPQDIKARSCVVARRTIPGRAGKLRGVSTEPQALVESVLELLGDAQTDMCAGAAAALQTSIVDVTSFMELRDVVQDGMWARGPWAGSLEDEAAVYQETGATLRCIPLQQPVSIWSGYSTCLYSGYQAAEVALFARAL